MYNKVKLTDDELAVIQTSLLLSLKSFEKFKEENDLNAVELKTAETMEELQQLFDRFKIEYF